MLNSEWFGKDPTEDHQPALKFLFHDCPPKSSSWALTTMSLMFARQAILEILRLCVWQIVPFSYILCAEDRAIQPQWYRRAAREQLGVDPIRTPRRPLPLHLMPPELAHALAAPE